MIPEGGPAGESSAPDSCLQFSQAATLKPETFKSAAKDVTTGRCRVTSEASTCCPEDGDAMISDIDDCEGEDDDDEVAKAAPAEDTTVDVLGSAVGKDTAGKERSVSDDDSEGTLQVGKYAFEKAKTLHGHRLQARGSSHLAHWGLEVCSAVLYLPSATSVVTGDDVMDPGVAKQLELRYLRNLSGDQFRLVTRWSIERNGMMDKIAAAGLAEFNPLYQNVKKGDCYKLSYIPGSGGSPSVVTLELNGVLLGTVEGAEFSRRIFSVWFGPRPFLDKFRDEILEKARLRALT